MRNKKVLIILFLIVIVSGLLLLIWHNFIRHTLRETKAESENAAGQVEYWTCSMHPNVKSDKPGKCPICAMELIPVYKGDKGKIVVDNATKNKVGIVSYPVESRHLIKTLSFPGKVSHDYDFYILQQEYLSAFSSLNKFKDSGREEILKRQQALLDASRLRLKLLGLSSEQIGEIENNLMPRESLIYPSEAESWILADIYEQDLAIINPGQEVKVVVEGYNEEFPGVIYAIEEVLNPLTRSAKARIKLFNPKKPLKHETFAEANVVVDLGNRLSISKDSLIDTGARKIIYLDLGDGRYQSRDVVTGIEAGDSVEVLKGVSEGELVVQDGNFLLDSQSNLVGSQELLYGAGEEIKTRTKEPVHKH